MSQEREQPIVGSMNRRVDAIEARMPARDDGPIVVRLRSAPGLAVDDAIANGKSTGSPMRSEHGTAARRAG